ncbi:hypothetical protein WMY93_006645 [Mugilogobius chulae]|uniref:Uncharacterized protein n=1 Tax=Mugilogobius chulae TaxID=88201 RepID=A0AAW0PL50_9GOBI
MKTGCQITTVYEALQGSVHQATSSMNLQCGATIFSGGFSCRAGRVMNATRKRQMSAEPQTCFCRAPQTLAT